MIYKIQIILAFMIAFGSYKTYYKEDAYFGIYCYIVVIFCAFGSWWSSLHKPGDGPNFPEKPA